MNNLKLYQYLGDTLAEFRGYRLNRENILRLGLLSHFLPGNEATASYIDGVLTVSQDEAALVAVKHFLPGVLADELYESDQFFLCDAYEKGVAFLVAALLFRFLHLPSEPSPGSASVGLYNDCRFWRPIRKGDKVYITAKQASFEQDVFVCEVTLHNQNEQLLTSLFVSLEID